MAVTIEVTVEPVACVEDVLSGFCNIVDVVGHLEAELRTLLNAVKTFGEVDVCCAAEEVVAVCSVEFETLGVEATASGADAELVVCVCIGLSHALVGECEVAFALTVTTCCARGVHL